MNRLAIVCAVLFTATGFLFAKAVNQGLVRLAVGTAGFQEHLGGEVDNIAQAIFAGRGFSDPFQKKTGSTAWMPPAIPTLLAGLYAVCGGERTQVVAVFYVLQLGATFFIFYCLGRFGQAHVSAMTTYAVLAFLAFTFCIHFFFFTHTHVFEMMAGLFVFFGLVSFCSDIQNYHFARISRCLLSGLAGGIAALVAPAFAFSWAVITSRQIARSFLSTVLAISVACAIASPWIGRNLRVFGRFVPIKSNAAFEGWQSTLLDDDGVLDSHTLSQHPFIQHAAEGKLYSELGELAYLSNKREQWLAAIAEDKIRYLEQIGNRSLAAFIHLQPAIFLLGTDSVLYWCSAFWKLVVLACLVYTLASRDPSSPVTVGVWMILITLMPYLIISYYERYSWQLIPIQAIVVFLTISRLGSHFRGSPRQEAPI